MEALAIAPTDSDALTQLAKVELATGNLGEAHRRIEEALTEDPSDGDAHITAGYIALARNRIDEANEHCRFVLANDASSRVRLRICCEIDCRRSSMRAVIVDRT